MTTNPAPRLTELSPEQVPGARARHNGGTFFSEMEAGWVLRRDFLSAIPRGDTLATTDRFGVEQSGAEFLYEVVDTIHQAIGIRPRVVALHPSQYFVETPERVQAQITLDFGKQLMSGENRGHFVVDMAGLSSDVLQIRDKLRAKYGASELATIDWWYLRSGERTDVHTVVMEPTKPVYDEFYPFLGEPVEQYLDRYMADTASILFLMGEPGTGKTSLIRHLLYTRRLNATLTYDEILLERDGLFVDFLTRDKSSILVIEDADTMLGSRETEQNKQISRFLNVSDGLIKMSNKKIVFTTNMGDFQKVDPALIRAGRCFGAVKFRALRPGEAVAAARVAGLPELDIHTDMTLAQLFNPTHDTSPVIAPIGF
jgi:hypothetical protein